MKLTFLTRYFIHGIDERKRKKITRQSMGTTNFTYNNSQFRQMKVFSTLLYCFLFSSLLFSSLLEKIFLLMQLSLCACVRVIRYAPSIAHHVTSSDTALKFKSKFLFFNSRKRAQFSWKLKLKRSFIHLSYQTDPTT